MAELNNLAINCLVSNQSLRAIRIFQRMLEYAELHGDMINMSHLLYSIGDAYREIGLWEDASDYFARALAKYQTTGLRGMEAQTAQYLAISYRELNDLKKAAMYAEQSAGIGAAEGQVKWETDARATLASIFFAADQHEQARAELARCLSMLGSIPASSSDPLEYYSDIRRLLREIAEQLSVPISSNVLHHLPGYSLSAHADDPDELATTLRHEITNLERLLDDFRSSGAQELEMETARGLALLHRETGGLEAAEAHAEQSVAIGISTGNAVGEITARATLVTILFAAGKKQQAYNEISRCLILLGSASAAGAENLPLHMNSQNLRIIAYAWGAPLSGEKRWGWDRKDT